MPYREPTIVPSCDALGAVFSENISVHIVTDVGIVKNGLVAPVENVLKKNNVKYAIYDKTRPNPTVDNVEEALKIYHKNDCDTLIAIGGGKYGTPHGLANAVIMPYVLESYGKCAYKKLHRLGVAAGVCNENDTHEIGARKFIEGIKTLNEKMNIPDKITGIRKEDISEMARHAEKEANPLYPVPKLLTRKELEGFYYQIADWSDRS